MIALVARLMERGVAYQAEDGSVYFAIDRFPAYGRLSRLDRREIKAGARVAQDDYSKENAQDFALWKAAKEEDERTGAAWDSPWGRGRPGWHLECSAMAMDILGETLDLHCGGVDLIFPHHEDEIAQSEAATGVQFSRCWCHGEFLLIDDAKMAKRVGNVRTVADLREQGISAAAVRHLMFSTHYRQQLNLVEDSLTGAMTSVRRIGDFADRLAAAEGGTPGLAAAAEELTRDALAALFDDLKAPEALGALHTFIRRANAELDRGGADQVALTAAQEAFTLVSGVLDVVPDKLGLPSSQQVDGDGGAPSADAAEVITKEWVEERIEARKSARARRDFATSDAIRSELEERGIAIEDTPAGTRWKRIR
jgi:cysteinyl-tRNA synthetase